MPRFHCKFIEVDVSALHTVLPGVTGGESVRARTAGQCLRKQLSRFEDNSFHSSGPKVPTAAKGGWTSGRGEGGKEKVPRNPSPAKFS